VPAAAPKRRKKQPLASFAEPTRRWFEGAFEAPTEVQVRGWPHIAAGDHALLLAPTGSGKTLAAFLSCLDRLCFTPRPERKKGEPRIGTRVLYVSPLKALAYDVERNLRGPLIGIERVAAQIGHPAMPPRVAIRSGDTTQKARRQWARDPSDILVTTPESLYLILTSQARDGLRSVETVIVDEVHALAPTKRGAHLALSLERLSLLTERDPQRIGLSATATPIRDVARYLGGDRDVAIVDATSPPALDLKVVVPVPDMTRPERTRLEVDTAPIEAKPAKELDDEEQLAMDLALLSGEVSHEPDDEPTPRHGIWPVIVPELLELIQTHRTTICFVNSRAMCERMVQRLDELGGTGLVRAHHGSLSHVHRREVEELLKTGRIKGIVATSSLELGIDMGTVDLVVMIESPGAVARGLQRVGRAGHGVGEVSKGRLFPKHQGDLLEATVVAERMCKGELEPLRVPKNPLDVLAQQIVAMCALEDVDLELVSRAVRRTASFAELPADALTGVLDMLSGRYPSTDFAELRPRLVWDRETDRLSARRGSRMLSIVSGGTIPDRGLYGVYLGSGEGARVGELDEEMVHETQPGQVITLGASSWRVEDITRDRVFVTPAPGEVGTMPFWRGEGPGRPIELGRAMGAFMRKLEKRIDDEPAARKWLEDDYTLSSLASENLVRYVREQRQATGTLPTDRAITVERFRDELGDHRICILSPFGARVHAPWALALQARFARDESFEMQSMWSDDGICLRIADADELPQLPSLLLDPEEAEELVMDKLGASALFASYFRENAARALLLPRRRPGSRTPLWQQRLKAQKLLAVAKEYPSFPIVIETYRECLQDVFDIPSLVEVLGAIRSRAVRVVETSTHSASPFARSLVFAFVATYLYEGDAPLAERRAQALSLDRNLLKELLGEDELRELLDPEIIDELERELQMLVPERHATHIDAVHDLLRRLGALSDDEVQARCSVPAAPLIEELIASRRVVRMALGGDKRLVAVEDAALYRDALGAVPPHGVPVAYLEVVDRPMEMMVARYARTHGPFSARALAGRYGLTAAAVRPVLRQLEDNGKVVCGTFGPSGDEWCDSEILRRIKRRAMARLRGEVEPVDRATFARFLPAWHGIDRPGKGLARLEEAIVQLEGMPLSYTALEGSLLPARVSDFNPRMLDELGAMGFVVWVGTSALGPGDGKVALYRRDHVAKLVDPPEPPDDLSPLARLVLGELGARGACFYSDVERACRQPAAIADGEAPSHDDVVEALWDLVWAGMVTNDTFQPLRALGQRRRAGRRGKTGTDMRTSGRWSLVAQLVGDGVSRTERVHARAIMLLERHGIVSRQAASLESLPGGFSGVYPVLRSMEEAGKLRRGYFVEGIGGAQFAFPGAVDRLRGLRNPRLDPAVTVLSAADPANPYGWIVPWPEQPSTGARQPKRHAGARLVLVDGVPTLFLDRGAVLLTFADADDAMIERAFVALRDVVAKRSKKVTRIETIDDQPALRSPHVGLLKQLGASFDHRGLVIEREV
jgi:ATP-dependent helicase Lhr and Lhr-like helicase